jgi:histidinol dehydrogenase
MARGASELARRIVAGAVFVGAHAPVAVGDYGIGPEPRAADRRRRALRVAAVGARLPAPLEPRADERARACGAWPRDVVRVALAEGFKGHAQSVLLRLQ